MCHPFLVLGGSVNTPYAQVIYNNGKSKQLKKIGVWGVLIDCVVASHTITIIWVSPLLNKNNKTKHERAHTNTTQNKD
jgi:hypothetical protein